MDGPLANDVISYGYDQLGRVLTRATDGVPLTLTYDTLGRVEREVNALGAFDYTFDGVSGRLATVTYPNSQTSTYTYYPAGQDHRLQTIDHRYPNGATLSKFDYTYDIVGNILTWRQQADTTAVIWDYGYDRADQLIRAVKRATDPQATILQRFAYGYDPAGNRLYEQIDDSVTSWTYDRLNRLVTQQAGGLLRVAGSVNEPATVRVQGQPASVDATGAFSGGVPVVSGTTRFTITATDASGNSTTQSYDVDQAGSSKTFTFDANGNMTSDGTRTFEWDARNELTALAAGSHRTEFTYDGFMRRVDATEKDNGIVQGDARTLWCARIICQERSADGSSVTRRAFEFGERVGDSDRYFAADHLGSVIDITDAQSTVLASYSFDPFGRRTLTSGVDATTVAFTGQTATGGSLSLTLHRGYDPELGRWLSEDPASLRGGLNLYSYVDNNPINLRDPLGLEPCAQTPCDELLRDILRLAEQVAQRYEEYNHPRWRLPLTGRMSRQSHINAINEVQRGLRNRIQKYNDQQCPTPLPANVEDVATRPTPVLSPSPVHLPELPPPTPQQTRNMAAQLTMGLLMTAGLILWMVFG